LVYIILSLTFGGIMEFLISVGNPQDFLFWLSGVSMTIFSIAIFASTFVPIDSCCFFPRFSFGDNCTSSSNFKKRQEQIAQNEDDDDVVHFNEDDFTSATDLEGAPEYCS